MHELINFKLNAWYSCVYNSILFYVATDGAKRVSLNEKERGFPQGLRVMSEPDGHGSPILHVPSTFDSLQIRDGQSYTLAAVEVKPTKICPVLSFENFEAFGLEVDKEVAPMEHFSPGLLFNWIILCFMVQLLFFSDCFLHVCLCI